MAFDRQRGLGYVCIHDPAGILSEPCSQCLETSKFYRPQSTGIGGAPNRAVTLPDDGKARKRFPVATGVMDYFPDALAAVSEVSFTGNEQHNPGKPVHWDRTKSGDEADTMIRHFLQRGSKDTDGMRHSAKMAWRALALLQKEIEEDFNNGNG